MRKAVILLAMLGVVGVLATQAAAAAKPTVTVTATTVKAGVVTVSVRLSAWKLYPGRVGKRPNAANGGHWHLFVDGVYASASGRLTAKTKALKAGKHRIWAELANNDHSRLKPPVRSRTVIVTVPAAAPGTTTPGTTTPGTTTDGAGTTTDPGSGGYVY